MAFQSPFFTVIIPVYNKEHFIENTLNAVCNQTFQDFEIIVINDGSTDSSKDIITRFLSDKIKLVDQSNQGVSSARNLGIKLAQGEYIAFLDADDLWQVNFLESLHQTIIKYPNYKVFATAIEIETPYRLISANYNLQNLISENIYIENYFKASTHFSILWTSASVFNKSIFDEVGCFDVSLITSEDTDLWIRIGLKYPIVFINKILARYVLDMASLSRNKSYKNMIRLKYDVYKKDEKLNQDLKHFLDLNRYSEAIANKIATNFSNYRLLKNGIDIKKLPLKKRIILHMPRLILITLIDLQPLLIKLKLRKTVYK